MLDKKPLSFFTPVIVLGGELVVTILRSNSMVWSCKNLVLLVLLKNSD